MKFLASFLCALICFSTSFLAADTFTDKAEWTESVCGTIIGDDFESFVSFEDGPVATGTGLIPTPQSLAWGQLSQVGNVPEAISVLVFVDPDSVELRAALADETTLLKFDFDPSLGSVDGFCFRLIPITQSGVVAKIYDGETLVETVTSGPGQAQEGDAVSFFGWNNTGEHNATRIEFYASNSDSNASDQIALTDGEFSFGGGVCQAETKFDVLEGILADAWAIGSTGDNKLDKKINKATKKILKALKPERWDENGNPVDLDKTIKDLNKAIARFEQIQGNAEVDQVLADLIIFRNSLLV